MFLCLCIIVFIIGCCMEASGKDWERSERNKERRHQELMEAQKKRKTVTMRRILRDEVERMERNAERRHREALEQQKNLSSNKQGKKTTRYIARDKDGRVIGKEVIEE